MGEHTALFYPCPYGKFLCQIVSTDDSCTVVTIKHFDDRHKLIWDGIISKDSPKCWEVNAIKGFGKFNKVG